MRAAALSEASLGPAARTTDDQPSSVLRIKAVRKLYRDLEAIRNVSFDVADGEFLSLLGPSGCGKSTLLNLIAGLDVPTFGTIQLDQRSTTGFSAEDWTKIRRQSIGIVFQAFHLIPGLTVEENVAFPLLLRGEQGLRVRERVAQVLELVRMTHRAAHRPSELSGGEQQRVAVARAIVHEPKIVLADEPTGNLDSKSGAAVMKMLDELHADGATVCLATHNPDYIARAERHIYLFDGRIVDQPVAE